MRLSVISFLILVLPFFLLLAAPSYAAETTASTPSVAALQAKAEHGNADAELALGIRYFNGDGVDQDAAEAVKWFRKAADRGNVKAQTNLGAVYSYFNASEVPQDYPEAIKWYRKAANQGDPVAQDRLAFFYAKGLGVKQDDALALKWYLKAAKRGNAKSQRFLADIYIAGRGVKKNNTEAGKWISLAEGPHDDAAQEYTAAANASHKTGNLYLSVIAVVLTGLIGAIVAAVFAVGRLSKPSSEPAAPDVAWEDKPGDSNKS